LVAHQLASLDSHTPGFSDFDLIFSGSVWERLGRTMSWFGPGV
jgi:hypothetical protein